MHRPVEPTQAGSIPVKGAEGLRIRTGRIRISRGGDAMREQLNCPRDS